MQNIAARCSADTQIAPSLPPEEAAASFRETQSDYSSDQAITESSRCFNCGQCVECDICGIFCPDMAVIKDNNGLSINLDYCKGCGICAVECPRSAIDLEEENRQ